MPSYIGGVDNDVYCPDLTLTFGTWRREVRRKLRRGMHSVNSKMKSGEDCFDRGTPLGYGTPIIYTSQL